ncbi:putative two-component system sensor histidine kinase [Microscilla marina ATCC 23134]|uniref:Putative two-component system sensor histidine kinase n=2 Tax=Microscilla marina TaxID=1027 RepID=A1ZI07_MICM2|nr:putative two-component system sensor histidine kinase [Microscilla marina ATCC 23134]
MVEKKSKSVRNRVSFGYLNDDATTLNTMEENNFSDKLNRYFYTFFSDKYRITHHFLFWIAYLLFHPIFLFDLDNFAQSFSESNLSNELPWLLLHVAIDVAMVYTNLYVLVPTFLMRGQVLQYLIFSALFIGINDLATYLATWLDFTREGDITFVTHSHSAYYIINILFLGTAVSLKFFKTWIKNQQEIRHLERANLETELDFLKTQINPHFLFNTLNNIYVLTRIDAERASKSLLMLSDLMRYQLYDCSKKQVALKDEITYINNLLDLEKIRKTNANIDFKVNGKVNGQMLSPFIFVPFVENAVKHGLNVASNPYIHIEMNVHKEEEALDFVIVNSKKPQPSNQPKDPNSGIGLVNVRRRLELLYPGKHELDIQNDETVFKVTLKLKL